MSEKEQTMNKMDDMKKELAHLEDKMDGGEDVTQGFWRCSLESAASYLP